MNPPNNTKKLAIIAGAGPGGLTAAYELKKRTNIQPIVFEKTDDLGGISQTAKYKGNRIDLGGHRFYTKSRRVQDWWFSLLPIQAQENFDFTTEQWSSIDDGDRLVDGLVKGKKIDHINKVRKPAPHPDWVDEVMLSRTRLSRIFHNNRFFPCFSQKQKQFLWI